MSSYNLVYFDIRGRAECSRVLLALAGAPYTEVRVSHDEWPAMKTSGRCPFGQLPVLELGDGKTICQSAVVFRFLANELGLSPNGNYDKARADMLVDAVKDLKDQFGQLFREKDAERKAKMKSSLYNEKLPQQMEFFDKLLLQNNGHPYFVGDKITYADVNFFCFLNGYFVGGSLEVPELIKKHPLLVDHYNRVMNEPKILEYLKNRKPNPEWYPY